MVQCTESPTHRARTSSVTSTPYRRLTVWKDDIIINVSFSQQGIHVAARQGLLRVASDPFMFGVYVCTGYPTTHNSLYGPVTALASSPWSKLSSVRATPQYVALVPPGKSDTKWKLPD